MRRIGTQELTSNLQGENATQNGLRRTKIKQILNRARELCSAMFMYGLQAIAQDKKLRMRQYLRGTGMHRLFFHQ